MRQEKEPMLFTQGMLEHWRDASLEAMEALGKAERLRQWRADLLKFYTDEAKESDDY